MWDRLSPLNASRQCTRCLGFASISVCRLPMSNWRAPQPPSRSRASSSTRYARSCTSHPQTCRNSSWTCVFGSTPLAQLPRGMTCPLLANLPSQHGWSLPVTCSSHGSSICTPPLVACTTTSSPTSPPENICDGGSTTFPPGTAPPSF